MERAIGRVHTQDNTTPIFPEVYDYPARIGRKVDESSGLCIYVHEQLLTFAYNGLYISTFNLVPL